MNEIIFLKLKNGKIPVEEFLDSLSSKEAQKMTWVLKLIEEEDIVSSQFFKKLKSSEEIWECRLRLGSNSFRILGFFNRQKKLVLTNGFAKKTQKTPKEEIVRAEKLRREYLGGEN